MNRSHVAIVHYEPPYDVVLNGLSYNLSLFFVFFVLFVVQSFIQRGSL